LAKSVIGLLPGLNDGTFGVDPSKRYLTPFRRSKFATIRPTHRKEV
jgi:hypothetical protein